MSGLKKHSPSSVMRFFDSPYESLIYKYLREVDPKAVQEDPEDAFMQIASKKGEQHELELFKNLSAKDISSRIILDGDPEQMIEATKLAMSEGIELIYQAALGDNEFFEGLISFTKSKVNQILGTMLMRFGMQNLLIKLDQNS